MCSNLQVVLSSVIPLPSRTAFGSQIAGLTLNFTYLLSVAVLHGGKLT